MPNDDHAPEPAATQPEEAAAAAPSPAPEGRSVNVPINRDSGWGFIGGLLLALGGGGAVVVGTAGTPDSTKTAVIDRLDEVERKQERADDAQRAAIAGLTKTIQELRDDVRARQEGRTVELLQFNTRLEQAIVRVAALETWRTKMPDGVGVDRWTGSNMELLWSRFGEALRRARVDGQRVDVDLPDVRDVVRPR